MRSSNPLYDALSTDYDAHFDVPHRRAYDDLAWEIVTAALPPPPARLLDIGTGVGRWAARLMDLGYELVGIEPAPAMADEAARRLDERGLTLHRCRLEEADIAPGSLDAALAMGSLQYSNDIDASMARVGRWLRPRAPAFVLVDSAVALGLELIARGEIETALERLETGRGIWEQHGLAADLHLLTCAALERAFRCTGFEDIRSHGLLVGASALGLDGLAKALKRDYAGRLAIERRLALVPELVDVGKQLLVVGRRPTVSV